MAKKFTPTWIGRGAARAIIGALVVLNVGVVTGGLRAGADTRPIVGIDGPTAIATNSAGDIFVASYSNATVLEIPAHTGVHYGIMMSAGVPTVLLNNVEALGLAVDKSGDIFVSESATSTTPGINVIAAMTGKIFGVPVNAGEYALLFPDPVNPGPLFIDGAGDLYSVNFANVGLSSVAGIDVTAPKAATLFGMNVPANTPTPIAGLGQLRPNYLTGLANGTLFFDAFGASGIYALSPTTTTVLGVPVVANTPVSLPQWSPSANAYGLAVDAAGDLLVGASSTGSPQSISVVPNVPPVYGQPVAAEPLLSSAQNISVYVLTVDAQGNVLYASAFGDDVGVIPKSSATIFGTAPGATVLPLTRTLTTPTGVAVDSANDVFTLNQGTGEITVLAPVTRTIFGQLFVANEASNLQITRGLADHEGITVDAAGDLYFTSALGIDVIAPTAKYIDEVYCAANQVTTLVSSVSYAYSLTTDSSGNLYVSIEAPGSMSHVDVIAPNATTIFGQSVGAGTPVALTATGNENNVAGIAFDSSGDLWIANGASNTVSVVSKAGSNLFGVSGFTANKLSAFAPLSTKVSSPLGIAFDPNGDLIVTNYGLGTVVAMAKTTGVLYGMSLTANAVSPPFQDFQQMSHPVGVAVDSAGDIFVSDVSNNWLTVAPPNGIAAPTHVTVTPGLSSLTVSWTAPTNTSPWSITSYTAFASRIGGEWSCTTASATSCTILGVDGSKPVNVFVYGTSLINGGALSTPTSAQSYSPAAAPTITSVTPSPHALKVKFTAPTSTGNTSVTGYQYSLNAGASWVNLKGASITTFTVTGLTAKHTYKLTLRAVTAAGSGLSSAPRTVSTT